VYCLHGNYAADRIGDWDSTLEGSMVMEGSLANYGKHASPSLLQPWLHVLCMWGLLVLHQYLTQQHKRFCLQMDRNVITPSDYTCIFSGLPSSARNEQELGAFVEGLLQGAKVSRVNFAYDIGDYVKTDLMEKALKCQYHKLKHIYETTGALPNQKRLLVLPGPAQSLEAHKALLDQTDQALKQLYTTHEQRFAGIAFVSFEQDESNFSAEAKEFALLYGKKRLSLQEHLKKIFCGCIFRDIGKGTLIYQGNAIVVKRAPEPDDIMWENLGVIATQVSKIRRKRRRIVTYMATLVVLLACAGVIYLSSLSKSAIKDRKKSTANPSNSENLLFGVLIFLPSTLVVIINMVLAITIRRFSLLELHKTYTNYDSSVFVKLAISMFINTAIIPILVHWGNWYDSAGLTQEVYNILIANAVIPPVVMVFGPKRLWQGVRQCLELRKDSKSLLSQAEANSLFEGPPIDMAQRSAVLMKTYLLTLFYTPILPIAYPIAIVALVLQYWSEKYMLLRVHSRPEVLSHELDESMLAFISLGTILYAVTNFFFFYKFTAEAMAPGIVGLVTTLAYCFIPVKKLIKLLKSSRPVAANGENGAVMSESPMTYEEAIGIFVDDYDRSNPMTAAVGKRKRLEAMRKCGQLEGADFFPGADIPEATNAVARDQQLRRVLGLAGPQRLAKAGKR